MTRELTHTIGVQASATPSQARFISTGGPEEEGQTESTCVFVHTSSPRTATPLPAVAFRGASSPVMLKMPLLKRRMLTATATPYTVGTLQALICAAPPLAHDARKAR